MSVCNSYPYVSVIVYTNSITPFCLFFNVLSATISELKCKQVTTVYINYMWVSSYGLYDTRYVLTNLQERCHTCV